MIIPKEMLQSQEASCRQQMVLLDSSDSPADQSGCQSSMITVMGHFSFSLPIQQC